MNENQAHIHLPPQALRALDILGQAGFEAWVVGGWVRDALAGRHCDDVDIACSATWQQSEAAFLAAGAKCHETGVKHGTLTVVLDDLPMEITTFRTDGSYSDGRHPDQVRFVASIEEDLARRDFSVNAMAWHPQRGLLDPFGGLADLHRGILRCVGCAGQRFSEDRLRILRAARFESQLGFRIEEETARAMIECAGGLANVAVERQMREWDKLLCGAYVKDALLHNIDVLGETIPELLPMKGFDQRTPFHCYDVLEHSAWVVSLVDATPRQRWAALLHDIGKPRCFTIDEQGLGHFKGHPAVSAQMAEAILKRLKLSPKFTRDVVELVARHDMGIIARSSEVKQLIREMGGRADMFFDLCKLKRADATARSELYSRPRVQKAEALLALLEQIQQNGECFSLEGLAVNGSDLLAAGIAPGPKVGKILNLLLDQVIQGFLPNEKQALLGFLTQNPSLLQ